jgi:O-antigen/teichoic acid export membrane protein
MTAEIKQLAATSQDQDQIGIGSPLPDDESRRAEKAFISGLAWTGTVKWLTQGISWVFTLILARLLSPADFGMVGMSGVYFGLVNMLNEFGLGTAIVTMNRLPREQISQVYGFSVSLGIVGFVVSMCASIPLAAFYKTPELRWVIMAMSLSLIISGFKSAPYSLLQRDMKFKSLAVIEGLIAFFLPMITITLAWLGFRYWSLVIGNLCGMLASTILVLVLHPCRPSLPRIRSLRPILTFSWHVMVQRFCWYGYSNADFVVAGRVLGRQALGMYGMAWTLSNIPVDRLASLVIRIAPSFLSKFQDDPQALRRYFLRLNEGIALLTIPLACGIGLLGGEFIPLVIGDRWVGAVRALQILSFYTIIRVLTPLLMVILTVTRQTRYAMYVALFGLLVLPVAFYIGSYWGTAGIAASWLIGLPLVTFPNFVRVFRTIHLSLAEYLRSMYPIFGSCLAMSAAVVFLEYLLPGTIPPVLRMCLKACAGAAVYGVILYFFQRERVHALLQLLRVRISKTRLASAAASDDLR